MSEEVLCVESCCHFMFCCFFSSQQKLDAKQSHRIIYTTRLRVHFYLCLRVWYVDSGKPTHLLSNTHTCTRRAEQRCLWGMVVKVMYYRPISLSIISVRTLKTIRFNQSQYPTAPLNMIGCCGWATDPSHTRLHCLRHETMKEKKVIWWILNKFYT